MGLYDLSLQKLKNITYFGLQLLDSHLMATLTGGFWEKKVIFPGFSRERRRGEGRVWVWVCVCCFVIWWNQSIFRFLWGTFLFERWQSWQLGHRFVIYLMLTCLKRPRSKTWPHIVQSQCSFFTSVVNLDDVPHKLFLECKTEMK